MNELIKQILDPLGVPVEFQTYGGKASTYITFFNTMENAESYADNEETSTGYYIQVDVWSKSNYATLVASTLKMLKQAGFRRTYMTEFYEKDTKIFHKVIRVSKFEEVL